MSDTVISSLITLAAALGGSVITLAIEFVRKHYELRERRMSIYEQARIAALQDYCAALGDLVLYQYQKKRLPEQRTNLDKSTETYSIAMHRVLLYVSDETLQAILDLGHPLASDVNHPSVRNLHYLLHQELRDLHPSSAARIKRLLNALSPSPEQ